MGAITTYGANAAAAIRTSLRDRTNFVMQAGGMVVNDVFFLLLWYMFFAGFKRVGSWGLPDVALLLGMMMCVVGIAGVFFGGYRDLAASILRGEIDALLTQPRAILPRLIARESIPTAWGDLVMGVWLLATFAAIGGRDMPLLLLGIVCGIVIYIGAAVIYASLAFWFAGARSFARDLTDFMIMFSSYPGSIYSGMTRVVAYSILPAGFIVMAPVALLQAPSLRAFAILIAATLGYAGLALAAFALGLRRYRRGVVPTA